MNMALAKLSLITIATVAANYLCASVQADNSRDDYLCPNGKIVKTSGGNVRVNDERVEEIYAEIIIGKSLEEYSREEFSKLQERIANGINVSTSYKLKDLKKGGYSNNYVYTFRNSSGREITLNVPPVANKNGFIIDNNGKKIKLKEVLPVDQYSVPVHEFDAPAQYRKGDVIKRWNYRKIICIDNFVYVRQVAPIYLDTKIDLPLMFFIREVKIKNANPVSEETFSF